MDPSLIYDVNDNIVIDTCFQKNCNRLKHGFDFEKLDEKTAAEDACKMEHVISDASMEAIKRHAAGRIK